MADLSLALPGAPEWTAPALDAYARAHLLFRDVDFDACVRSGRGRLNYLATPYSRLAVDDDGYWSMNASLLASARAARWSRAFAIEGVTTVSPIVQSAEMVHVDIGLSDIDPLDGRFWEAWCRPILRASDTVIVPPIDGWRESVGIWREVVESLGAMRPVYVMAEGETWT